MHCLKLSFSYKSNHKELESIGEWCNQYVIFSSLPVCDHRHVGGSWEKDNWITCYDLVGLTVSADNLSSNATDSTITNHVILHACHSDF